MNTRAPARTPTLKKVSALSIHMPLLRGPDGRVYGVSRRIGAEELAQRVDHHIQLELADVRAQAKKLIQQYQEDCTKRLAELHLEDRGFNVPDASFLLANKIIVGKSGSSLVFYLPFQYHPLYLNGEPLKDKEKIWRDGLYFQVCYTKDLTTITRLPYVVQPDGSYFSHYHGGAGVDCYGSFKPDMRTPVAQLPALRDMYQTLLENINRMSIRNSNPAGLPTIHSLEIEPTGQHISRWAVDPDEPKDEPHPKVTAVVGQSTKNGTAWRVEPKGENGWNLKQVLIPVRGW